MAKSSERKKGENERGTPVSEDDASSSDDSSEAIAEELPALMPEQLFLNKDQLVVLTLEGFRINLPESIVLPCLRSFSLTQAALSDNWSDDPWTRFLSNCPVLEYLNIELCQGLEKLSVCSSSIKMLRVALEKDPKTAIFIETPNLEVLHLSSGIIQSRVNDLSSLVDAQLDIWTSSVMWIELLQRICCTKTLYLYHIFLDGSNASMTLPIFQNLTHMEVEFSSWSIVLPIIRHAPKLVSFITHKFVFDWPDRNPIIKDIPLTRMEFRGFDGQESFEVLEYFLSHSALLKKVIINTRSSLDSEEEFEILKRILKLRRASSHCRIIAVNEKYGYNSEDDSDTESEGESDRAADIET